MKITFKSYYEVKIKGSEVLILEEALRFAQSKMKTYKMNNQWTPALIKFDSCGNCHFKKSVRFTFDMSQKDLEKTRTALKLFIKEKSLLNGWSSEVEQAKKLITYFKFRGVK